MEGLLEAPQRLPRGYPLRGGTVCRFIGKDLQVLLQAPAYAVADEPFLQAFFLHILQRFSLQATEKPQGENPIPFGEEICPQNPGLSDRNPTDLLIRVENPGLIHGHEQRLQAELLADPVERALLSITDPRNPRHRKKAVPFPGCGPSPGDSLSFQ